MDQQKMEEILRKTQVLQEGHFLLTSGRHSRQYMQCARILEYPWHMEEVMSVIANQIKGQPIDLIVGPAMGGIIVAYELARQLQVRNFFAEREEGKMTLRRGFTIPKGAKVIIAEDVITTGGSVQEVMDLVKEVGGEVVGVAVLVDRSNGNIDFGCPLYAAYTANIVSYEERECPLCKEGKIDLIKPGSRKKI
ncbi:MAG: orotate phosphoribosyltransferase [Epulopiscium sp.]|nr:orotate phosphoribosyltransferase [Candidatus Epulonipiscium sp.]